MTTSTGHDGARALLLRYSGELSTKAAPTRRQFVAQLRRNVKDALNSIGVAARVEAAHDRILVHGADAGALDSLGRVFGVSSLSVAEPRADASLPGVVAAGREIFRETVDGRRFAARARIVGRNRSVAYRSPELERELGTALEPFAAGVDLEHPEVTARVEIYQGKAWFCLETRKGPAGLPVGTAGRALALVSGGFDSAVAAWLLLKRGVQLDYLFCNLGGRAHELGVLRVMKLIADGWSHGYRPRLHAVDFEPVTREIQSHATPRYWQVLLKRFMLRAGEAVAREQGAEALVTGEAVGQVSSQTLTNLASISEVSTLPILRPLVGFNKEEIIERADAIGTGPLSAVVHEYCSMVSRNPATAARPEALREQESRLDLGVLSKVVGEREVLDLRSVDPEERGLPELRIDEVPQEATLIDLRSRPEFAAWHHEGSVQLDFAQALRAFPSFERTGTYVLVCEFGLKSAHLAELMRAEGLRAFHFRGGTRQLRRWSEKAGGGVPLEV